MKTGDPNRVLAALGDLPSGGANDPAAAREVRAEAQRYLSERRDQIRYAEFRDRGWPIGSGAVESANKLVVEARLKGAGMSWAEDNVDPMLTLRGLACGDRWATVWPTATPAVRTRARAASAQRRRTRATVPVPPAVSAPPFDPPPAPPAVPALSPRPKLVVAGKPTAAHPWKQPFLPRPPHPSPKL
ncbi:MAG: hypothetical protein M3Q71_16400 [Chloroflexota bacterium]|nr:hypothetical protein [Chloroflexota bacterium]